MSRESSEIEDMCVRYDWLKYNIRKYSINYCRKCAKCRKTKENEIVQELQRLDEKIGNETACDGKITRYNELKNGIRSYCRRTS